MNTNNTFIAFVVEIVQRIGMKSPKVFVILQWVGSTLTALTGLPWLLDKLFDFYGYIPPTVFTTMENKTAALCGIIATFVAALPVKGDTVAVGSNGGTRVALKVTDPAKLPFTQKEDEKTNNQQPVIAIQTKPDVH